MFIILPKNKLKDIEKSFNLEKFNEIKNSMKMENVKMSIPKFKFKSKNFLSKELSELGMPTAFKFSGADFSGITNNKDLFINEVIHQAFIENNEKGTEAGAATAIIMEVGVAYKEPKIFNVNHPFMFIIQEKSTQNILFLGRINDPTIN